LTTVFPYVITKKKILGGEKEAMGDLQLPNG
jgi:hypothetical protein